ncbi:uncharacterized protein TM35_000281890, partial [Trypanosoma theileri]
VFSSVDTAAAAIGEGAGFYFSPAGRSEERGTEPRVEVWAQMETHTAGKDVGGFDGWEKAAAQKATTPTPPETFLKEEGVGVESKGEEKRRDQAFYADPFEGNILHK